MRRLGGNTLAGLLLGMLLALLLLGMASSTYRQVQARRERMQAVLLLQKNALFMEAFQRQHGSYKQTPVSWPLLPYPVSPESGPVRYRIQFGAEARNTDEGYYVLRAVGSEPHGGGEVISLTQRGLLKYCVRDGGNEHCELLS